MIPHRPRRGPLIIPPFSPTGNESPQIFDFFGHYINILWEPRAAIQWTGYLWLAT
jgi:hypothetical protein